MLRSNLGRNSVESNIDFSLNSRKEIFKGHLFCESHDMDILGTNKIKEKRSVVVCKDLEVLLYEIIKYRDIDQNKHLVKIGIDGGQQFLKICLSLVSLDDIKPKPLQGVFNDDGVKKILILGIAENIKESYDNLEKMLKPMNLTKVKLYCAMDLKVASMVLGMQSASSSFPCIYCEKEKKTFGDVQGYIDEESNENELEGNF